MEVNSGEIYLITNDINDYAYVGKTYTGYLHRFSQHRFYATAKDENGEYRFNTKLYKAMRKIGVEHFKVECLGSFAINDLEKAEQFYIKQFNSFENGYNSTEGGGAGKRNTIPDDIVEDVIILRRDFDLSIVQIQNTLGISNYTVRRIAHL